MNNIEAGEVIGGLLAFGVLRLLPGVLALLNNARTKAAMSLLIEAARVAVGEALRTITAILDEASTPASPGGKTITPPELKSAIDAGVSKAVDSLARSGVLPELLRLMAGASQEEKMDSLKRNLTWEVTRAVHDVVKPPPGKSGWVKK